MTANPIIGEGSPIDKHFIPDYKVIRDSLEKEYPLNDAVRMWCAPFAGKVNIQSTIKNLAIKVMASSTAFNMRAMVSWSATLYYKLVAKPTILIVM